MPANPARLTASQAATRLHVSPKTVARWANEGRLAHRVPAALRAEPKRR